MLLAWLLMSGCGRDSQGQGGAADHAGVPLISAPAVSNSAPAVSSGMQANPLESTNIQRAFVARGIVREIPAGGQTLWVKHEDIPGFMPKMTMEFDVKNSNELTGLKVGDTITFVVRATEKESWIEGIRPAGTNDVRSTAPADPSSAALLRVDALKVGEPLPDASLIDEEGRTLRLTDFPGRAVAFTFIFTRCPLPDFCPRMNQHFSRARELLFQQTDGPTNWQFLSISFDPDFDKPGVLNRYAYSYRGANTNRWLFAAAPSDVMKTLSSQLDFRFANEGGSFLHNLRTVVMDPNGRLYRQFDGNKWKAEDLARALAEAAALPTPKTNNPAK